MKIGKISSNQLLFLVAGYIQGGTLVVGFTAGITKHDTWIALLAGFAISLPWVWIYGSLLERFPRNNLVEINAAVYGLYIGNAVSVLYILFYLLIDALLLRLLSTFINTYLLPETPAIAILSLFMLLSAWTLRYGVEVIARSNVVFVVIAMVIGIFTVALLIKDMKFTSFLPVFEVPLQDFIKGSHIIGAGAFFMIVFMMIAPYVNKIKEVKKAMLLGLILGGITLLILAVRNTAVLGPLEPFMNFTSYRAVRLINLGDILTRLEVLVSIAVLLLLFMQISMCYFATVLATAQLLNLKMYVPLVFPIGIIAVNIALIAFDSSAEQGVFDTQVMPFFFFVFEYIFPLILLFIVKIRDMQNKRGVECR